MNTKPIGETIQDIAASVANSKWGQAIIPTIDELNQTIAGDVKLAGSLYNENIQKSLASMLQGVNIPEEEAIKMAKTVKARNYEKTIDNLADDVSKYSDKPVDKVIERAKSVTKEEISKGIDPDSISIPSKIFKYPRAYFKNSDKEIRNTRIATAVGVYAGVSVGGRYLSGGTLTTDNYGRKDIAGIPLL